MDKWELSQPIEDGLGRLNFGFPDDLNEEPGFYTSIFNMQDPVQNRRIMGIARVNLGKKSVEFFPLGPATGVGSFSLAPGRQWGYGLHSEIGKYEFWSFDLANHKLGPRTEVRRPAAHGAEDQLQREDVCTSRRGIPSICTRRELSSTCGRLPWTRT